MPHASARHARTVARARAVGTAVREAVEPVLFDETKLRRAIELLFQHLCVVAQGSWTFEDVDTRKLSAGTSRRRRISVALTGTPIVAGLAQPLLHRTQGQALDELVLGREAGDQHR